MNQIMYDYIQFDSNLLIDKHDSIYIQIKIYLHSSILDQTLYVFLYRAVWIFGFQDCQEWLNDLHKAFVILHPSYQQFLIILI